MSLSSVIKPKEHSKNVSDKTPQFYNEEKNLFIRDMISHSDPSVRLIAVSNVHVPAKILSSQLQKETEVDVLRAILMNPNLSKKDLLTFATKDSRAAQFDDDEELIAYVSSLNLEK